MTQAPTIRTSEEPEEGGSSTLENVLSILGFAAAAAVVAFQCLAINVWDGWDKLF